MRIPRPVAWILLALTFFTAGLLRQFHDLTPVSPYAPTIVGSSVFAAVVLLLLVSAREWRAGPAPGLGIRIGSLTPLLLMLLLEKWASVSLYIPIFAWMAPRGVTDQELDAWYRGFAGVSLLVICLLLAGLSRPTRRRVWARFHPVRFVTAFGFTTIAIGATYLTLWGLAKAFGTGLELRWPIVDRLLFLVLVGQFVRAGAEEVYYRGLLLAEMERLAPRLGLRAISARRWSALLATSLLFGLEHLALGAEMGRQLIFTVSLGLLLGILVLVTNNLHFAAGMHAWINWLLLNVTPRFTDGSGNAALPQGTYIGVSMILAFVMAFLTARRVDHPASGRPRDAHP